MLHCDKRILTFLFFYCLFQTPQMVKAEELKLPKPNCKSSTVSLEETISKRRSIRDFLEKPLNIEQLSQLLWAAQGITAKSGSLDFRTAPSAGALYPMEIYILDAQGLYHYEPKRHTLEILLKKDLRQNLQDAALGQGCIKEAPLDIVICAVFERITQKYGQRGIRYAYIETGHIAQNIHLQAVALGLSSVPIGAFNDEKVKQILSLPEGCVPVYIIPVGYPAEK